MARKKVADLLVEVLAKEGVRQIYGVSGGSLNGITDSIRATKQIQWIHVRHEETAAFAAGAEAPAFRPGVREFPRLPPQTASRPVRRFLQ